MATKRKCHPDTEDSDNGHWIHSQEVESGKYFWIHSKTNQIRYTQPPSIKHRRKSHKPPPPSLPASHHRSCTTKTRTKHAKTEHNNHQKRNLSISHRRTECLMEELNNDLITTFSPKAQKQKSSTPPPPKHVDLSSISHEITRNNHNNNNNKITIPPPPKLLHKIPPKPPKKGWFGRKKQRSQTEGNLNWKMPNYVIIEDGTDKNKQSKQSKQNKPNKPNKPNKSKKNNQRKKARSHTTATRSSLNVPPSLNSNNLAAISSIVTKKESSKYDIAPNADIQRILRELIGYDILNITEAMVNNDYIKSNIDAILAYRYGALSLSHIKQFKPPLNDKCAEMAYFRNIEYPKYPLDTNLKIQQIINQNIYDYQVPYLRIRIPLNISKNVLGNKNLLNKKQSVKLSKILGPKFVQQTEIDNNNKEKKDGETFNIELSPENILNTTVQEFFHSVTKKISTIKSDVAIKRLFLGKNYDDNNNDNMPPLNEEKIDHEDDDYYLNGMRVNGNYKRMDWSKLAIKANGLEEYIFYSIDENDKICNYECVRYALSHQLDKDDNKCFLTLVYLDDFDDKISVLKHDYIEYEQYLSLWRKSVEQICIMKQQFNTTYPWLNSINQQFNQYPKLQNIQKSRHYSDIDYMKMNDSINEWKTNYDKKNGKNNIVFLSQYKCLFEYTIHSIINVQKLPRFDFEKYESIIISFELQIGHLSYEQDIFLTPPKMSDRMEFTKAIYKSKHLRINQFPREIILSIIIFGVPSSTSDTDIYSEIFTARSADNIPTWFPTETPSTSSSSHSSSINSSLDISDNPIFGGLSISGMNDIDIGNNPSNGDKSNSASPNLILKEEPIDIYKFNPTLTAEEKTPSFDPLQRGRSASTPYSQSTRRRQYSYGNRVDHQNIYDTDNDDDNRNYNKHGVFYRAFKDCDALGYCRVPLIDEFHQYRQGTFKFNLWDIPIWKKSKHEPRDPFGHDLLWRFFKPSSFPPTTHHNIVGSVVNQCQITITIGPNPENNPNYIPPIAISPLFNPITNVTSISDPYPPKLTFSTKDYKKMDSIVRRDPLTPLSKKERYLIWICREKLCKTKPRALPVFLSCVDWRNEYFRNEAYKYLYKWKLPNLYSDLIELLSSWNYPDNRIKHFVITQALSKLSDIQIKHVLLQLVQIIKLEAHNTSFTSNFLIQRALRSVTRIGHYLFWYLKTEIDASYTTYTRFSLILEDLLVHCFHYPSKLYIQLKIVDGLKEISKIVRDGKKEKQPTNELKLRMQHILRRMNKSILLLFKLGINGVSIPLNPKYKLKQLNITKCKFMGSAQAPLWLVFENFDIYSKDVYVLFKCGDDLRQDLLTLQVMDTMNQLWLISGYCMRFRIYNVITTGSTSGFIEIVTDSRTFNDLSVNLGGGIVGGPKDETVHVKYLKNKYRSTSDNKLRIAAQDRYLRSSAGYCIASWIIGIGDRHSDNIMVHECGDLFHIDFGHFLGNFKVKKFAVQILPGFKMKKEFHRERSPFVFLPAMKYCIKYDFKNNKPGNKEDDKNINYQRFIDLCTTAMDAIRRRQRLFINLFILMLPSQMPELLKLSDINYMKQQMILNSDIKNYDKIREYVKKELDDSVNDGVRIFDNIVHAYVHSK